MTQKCVIKAALALRGISYADIAKKACRTKRMVEYHISGTRNSPAVRNVLDKIIGNDIKVLTEHLKNNPTV